MKTIGLTGSSGAGKGEVALLFQKYGIPTVNTDEVYHELLKTDRDMIAELTAAFGKEILTDGVPDRKKLAKIVFDGNDRENALHILNEITHKYIMAKTFEKVRAYEKSGVRAVAVDAPQLFEAGLEHDFDVLLAVLADKDTRLARVSARDGIDDDAVKARFAAQKSDAFFKEHCQYILQNDADLAALDAAVRAFLQSAAIGVDL